MAVWTPSFPATFNAPNWNYTNAPAVLSLPGVIRYRQKTQDSHGRVLELTSEQNDCFLKHYPIGNMIPVRGDGLSLDEIEERMQNYCVTMKVSAVTGTLDAVEEMVAVGIVEEIRPN